MKYTCVVLMVMFFASCSTNKHEIVNEEAAVKYANTIDKNKLKKLLYTYAISMDNRFLIHKML